jgi:hypothetical protein
MFGSSAENYCSYNTALMKGASRLRLEGGDLHPDGRPFGLDHQAEGEEMRRENGQKLTPKKW